MRPLDNNTIVEALAALGNRLPPERQIEVLIIGGAAGVLINVLPATHTTADVDAIDFHQPRDRDVVLNEAVEVGRELSLPSNWMNDYCGLYAWTLPEGWKERREKIGDFGPLIVYAVSRIDLIAMKFIAHRTGDFEHLEILNVTSEDLQFVAGCLDAMAKRYPEDGIDVDKARQIALAKSYVNAWVLP